MVTTKYCNMQGAVIYVIIIFIKMLYLKLKLTFMFDKLSIWLYTHIFFPSERSSTLGKGNFQQAGF
jgi:hypothetical protein